MTTASHIKESVEKVIDHYTNNAIQARDAGVSVTATMEDGLRCRVEGADGTSIVTDMPKGIGGVGLRPSPGRLYRASLASCDATLLALRAAQIGLNLTTLEVTVEGDPDDTSMLGFLGIDENIPPGEHGLVTHFRLGSDSTSAEKLRELAEWVVAHSPVGDSVRRAIPSKTEIEII